MAVVSVNEWFDRGSRDNARADRERWRTYQVIVDDPTDGEDEILAHASIPQVGAQFDDDNTTLRCAERELTPFKIGESLLIWLVRCLFANNLTFASGDRWTWGTSFLQKISNRGYFYSPGQEGQGGGWSNIKIPYLTSALGRIESPPEYDEPIRILRVQRGALLSAYYLQQNVINAALMGSDGQGTVNQELFTYQSTEWQPGEVRFISEESENATPEGSSTQYVNATYTFHMRRGGWFDDIFDEDTHELSTLGFRDGVPVYKRSEIKGLGFAAVPVQSPVPLNGGGRPLNIEVVGGTVLDIANIPFQYMRYRKFDPFPYSLIGF